MEKNTGVIINRHTEATTNEMILPRQELEGTKLQGLDNHQLLNRMLGLRCK